MITRKEIVEALKALSETAETLDQLVQFSAYLLKWTQYQCILLERIAGVPHLDSVDRVEEHIGSTWK